MSGGVYGGEEVNALVFDFGSNTIRAGFAGEDSPKFNIPTCIACREVPQQAEEEKAMTEITNEESEGKMMEYFVGEPNVSFPRDNCEIMSPLKDGMIENWNLFEVVMEDIINKKMHAHSNEHPILMSEPAWNVNTKRETLTEVMFEKFDIPAFYICKNAVLSAFTFGKSSALVLDTGSIHTSAIPVFDGYCLTNSIVRSPLGGDFLTSQCKKYFQEHQIPITPHYAVASKESVKEWEPAKWTKKKTIPQNLTTSYREFVQREILQDFQATCLQLYSSCFAAEKKETPVASNPRSYELPDGFNFEMGDDCFAISEPLFSPHLIKNGGSANNNKSVLGVAGAVTSAISMTDIDIRSTLYSNVLITGGNSLLSGFIERVNADLISKIPQNCRLKLLHSNSSSERRFSAWIGGSILASLGTFQQMWISRQEYNENGKHIVDKKCA